MLFIMLEIERRIDQYLHEIELVTLMGLVSKHGILIVEFADDLQHAGKTKREAIIEGASIRLRPILMRRQQWFSASCR